MDEGNMTVFINVSFSNVSSNVPGTSVKLFELITNGVLLTSVALLGIVGNVMTIAVLSRPGMRSSINCCLIGLASFDIVVLVSSILMCGLKALVDYIPNYETDYYPHLMPVVYPFGLIAQTGSVWVTVSVTMERYIAVCHPLKARSLCTYGRARIYILAITIASILYNLPRFWEPEKVTFFDPKTNITTVMVIPSELRHNQTYVQCYIISMYLVVMYFLPFLTLAVLNGAIWQQVREANRERQRLSRLEKKEISLAIMLFCVVIVFFVCNMLALVVNLLEQLKIIVDELTIASNLLVTINSSVNFVIYCIFGQKFRRILVRMFCCCFIRKAESQLEESVYPMPSMNATETKPLYYNGSSLCSQP